MKDFALSYNKELSSINGVAVSPDTELIILYTHFMKNSKNAWNFGTHSHSFNELHVIISGKCEMCLESKKVLLTENEYILVPADKKHHFINCSGDFFRFSTAFDIFYDKKHPLIPSSSVLTLNQKCAYYMKNILDEYEESKVGYKSIADSMLCCLVIEILRQSNVFDSAKHVAHDNLRFFEILRFIDNNISHKIKVTDVAEEFFLSERHLNRIFSSNVNMTVSQYIKAKKINNSKEYLGGTGLSIKEISFLNGFDDVSAFCKFFKKETGVSPAKYRLSLKEKD